MLFPAAIRARMCVAEMSSKVVGAINIKPQAPGLNGKQPCLNRVDDFATYYLEQLRGVQPEGPYFLGGYSFGGLVALEMARRLVESGQAVGLLALVDTYPGVPKSAGSLIGTFFTLSSEQKFAYLKKRITRYRKGIKRRVDLLSMPRPLINVREACAVAEKNYAPRVYPGKIVLFRASEKALRGADLRPGARPPCSGDVARRTGAARAHAAVRRLGDAPQPG